jgi:hypothetical protein
MHGFGVELSETIPSLALRREIGFSGNIEVVLNYKSVFINAVGEKVQADANETMPNRYPSISFAEH